MASIYKNFTNNDKVSTRTLLHEAIPLTGTILSGTYVDTSVPPNPTNCKDYAHGMFQSVYDYPYLSSSANHVFDISVGIRSSSTSLSSSHGGSAMIAKKVNVYNQMAQVLMGYDANGSILPFDADGNIAAGGTTIENCYFINFARLLSKDEIAKGTFNLDIDVEGAAAQTQQGTAASNFTETIRVFDASGSNGYFVNSPAGEYGILYAKTHRTTSTGGTATLVAGETSQGVETGLPACGLIFYQAGVVVLNSTVFHPISSTIPEGILDNTLAQYSSTGVPGGIRMIAADTTGVGFDFITGSTISEAANALRHRIFNISFNNTVELNSTVYFCRANHHEFNYSGNPTYLNNSEIRVKTNANSMPLSFITSIGLYSAENELLGVAKLSEPIQKDPNKEFIFRCRLDY